MKKAIVLLCSLVIFGCAINVDTINRSKNTDNSTVDTELSLFANDYFWEHFHKGNFEKLDSMMYYLSAAYNENPNHLETINHLAFTNLWAISERFRKEEPDPRAVDYANLALKYYGESHAINPKDPRIVGFIGAMKLAVGDISDDKKLTTEGYFEGKKSIRQWPEFNYFTIGVTLSLLPHDVWQYDKAIEWQWNTLDECYCEKVDRENPDITKYMALEKTETNLKRKRACWNTWMVPHNVEGFFLNMGDMLVKKGDWKKAQQVYQLAKALPEYDTWDYKDVLERRITNAQENIAKFREDADVQKKNKIDDAMLINSPIACMVCHKKSEKDFDRYSDFNWQDHKKKNNIYWLQD